MISSGDLHSLASYDLTYLAISGIEIGESGYRLACFMSERRKNCRWLSLRNVFPVRVSALHPQNRQHSFHEKIQYCICNHAIQRPSKESDVLLLKAIQGIKNRVGRNEL